jgi:hypothetical protein
MVHVVIGDGREIPVVRRNKDNTFFVTAGVGPRIAACAYTRGVWVRVFPPGESLPSDGKGFLIGPTGKLTDG